MIVGVDFDNTIVCYDNLFHSAARERNLIPSDIPRNKTAIRDFLRKNGQEDQWTELQGYVYGDGMRDAEAFHGVAAFFTECKAAGIVTYIISHKTRYPFLGPKYDLHESS